MKKILKSNIFLVILLVMVCCFIISFISTDVVLSDKVYQRYLDEKYEEKYNEYKDLDIDLSEFEDELKQFEQTSEDSSYGWDTLYIDAQFIFIPLLIVTLGFSGTFLVLILFHKTLYKIRYLDILKASLLSYIVFYIPIIISACYFLIFNKTYELKDIHEFESYFSLSKLFTQTNTPKWLWDIVSQTDFTYFLYPLLVVLLLTTLYKEYKKPLLIGYSYLTYIIVFVFYNTVFWYLFDLV
ncbi:MAG: hypothetical protein ACK5MZ_04125 [Aestuariibaculum sp.]